jgi:hypothetical protein
MEGDPVVLGRKIDRLLDLTRQLGATPEQVRLAMQGPLHPDRVNLPAAGRFPKIDPAPYLALFTDRERWESSIPSPDDGPFCGAHISARESDELRKFERQPALRAVTTCILPAGHAPNAPGRPDTHMALLVTDPMWDGDDRPGLSRWQWLGVVRELGQVTRR